MAEGRTRGEGGGGEGEEAAEAAEPVGEATGIVLKIRAERAENEDVMLVMISAW
jgi:hypothetical protein